MKPIADDFAAIRHAWAKLKPEEAEELHNIAGDHGSRNLHSPYSLDLSLPTSPADKNPTTLEAPAFLGWVHVDIRDGRIIKPDAGATGGYVVPSDLAEELRRMFDIP